MESLFIILFVLRLLEGPQALNGSCSTIATHQDRKRHLSTFRTIQVATEYTFHSEKGQSSHLTISWSDYFQSHCCHKLGWVSWEVDSKFTPPLGAPYLFFFPLQHNSHSIEFRLSLNLF